MNRKRQGTMEKIKDLIERKLITSEDLDNIDKAIKSKDLIIIHGQSGSGKTTLAEALKEAYKDNVVLVDEGIKCYNKINSLILNRHIYNKSVILILHSSGCTDINYLQNRIEGICESHINTEDAAEICDWCNRIKNGKPMGTIVSMETILVSNQLSKILRIRRVCRVERVKLLKYCQTKSYVL